MQDKDSIIIGLAMGAIVPVLGYIALDFIFSLLVDFGLMSYVREGLDTRRARTILLLAICCNLIPFNISKRRKWDDTMRGIIFPTLIYVGFWIYTFRNELMLF